jgi:hypothetical protein
MDVLVLRAYESAGICLSSRCLAMGLYVTISLVVLSVGWSACSSVRWLVYSWLKKCNLGSGKVTEYRKFLFEKLIIKFPAFYEIGEIYQLRLVINLRKIRNRTPWIKLTATSTHSVLSKRFSTSPPPNNFSLADCTGSLGPFMELSSLFTLAPCISSCHSVNFSYPQG